MNVVFNRCRPEDPEAATLLEELSAVLAGMTGSSGKGSFANEDMDDPRSVFLVGRLGGNAVACGALRKIDRSTCELKRMYAREQGKGFGSLVLAELEREAARLGYGRIRLETRKVNQRAVRFYAKHGYELIPNFGRYKGNDAAVCFEKTLLGDKLSILSAGCANNSRRDELGRSSAAPA